MYSMHLSTLIKQKISNIFDQFNLHIAVLTHIHNDLAFQFTNSKRLPLNDNFNHDILSVSLLLKNTKTNIAMIRRASPPLGGGGGACVPVLIYVVYK